MTRDDIIKLMGWPAYIARDGTDGLLARVESVVRTAEEAEREACAQVCDAADKSTHPADLADAIRARGKL